MKHQLVLAALGLALIGGAHCLNPLNSQQLFESFDSALKVHSDVVLQSAQEYRSDELSHFQRLLFHDNSLFVGARDGVVHLDAASLSEQAVVHWAADAGEQALCEMKGQKPSVCHNFVRTLALVEGSQLLACGTHAFQPKCTTLQPSVLPARVTAASNGVGAVPYSPDYPHAFTSSSRDQQLFVGLPVDFGGFDSSLLRFYPSDRLLHTSDSKWLNAGQFVSMFELGNFIYFFFRERPLELELSKPCEKEIARVGRVCANDSGGRVSLRESFTTFTKATLSCRHDRLTFHHLVDAQPSPDGKHVAAIFTQTNANLTVSALCVYALADLSQVFASQYLTRQGQQPLWQTFANNKPFFNCEVKSDGETSRDMTEVQNLQLHSQPWQPRAVRVSALHTFSKVALDTRAVRHQTSPVVIVHVATEHGYIVRYTYNDDPQQQPEPLLCATQVMQYSTEAGPLGLRHFALHQEHVYLALRTHVLRVAVAHCDYSSRPACVHARDPLCGWHQTQLKCIRVTPGLDLTEVQQKVHDGCPRLLDDASSWHVGSKREWSAWTACQQQQGNGSQPCRCRHRQRSAEFETQVTNCTRDGLWSAWSAWSPCTASCGRDAVRERTRSCTSPRPQHGGAECDGAATEKAVCDHLDACPPPKLPEIDGHWSVWSSWSRCTRDCGGGVRQRHRRCNNPAPANGGATCAGCDEQMLHCNTQPCNEIRRWTEWTAWQAANASSSSQQGSAAVLLTRYKFACKAHIHDPLLLSVGPPRVEEKYCHVDNQECQAAGFAARDGGWTAWSAWSSCSQQCGDRGRQTRLRSCAEPSPLGGGADCAGVGSERRQCNAHPCAATWSCWSEWSTCNASCGRGIRSRQRHCEQQPGQTTCVGSSTQTDNCESTPCSDKDGYGLWSAWSLCSELAVRVRVRQCVDPLSCAAMAGPDAQMARCDDDAGGEAGGVAYSFAQSTGSQYVLIAAVIAAFICGVAVAVLGACWAVHTRSGCCFPLSKWPSTSMAQSISTTTTNQGSVSRMGGAPPGTTTLHVHHSQQQAASRHNNLCAPPPLPPTASLYTGHTMAPTRTSLNSAGILDNGLNRQQQPHIHSNPLDDLLATKMSLTDSDDGGGGHPSPPIGQSFGGSSELHHPGGGGGSDGHGGGTLKRHIRASMNPRDFL